MPLAPITAARAEPLLEAPATSSSAPAATRSPVRTIQLALCARSGAIASQRKSRAALRTAAPMAAPAPRVDLCPARWLVDRQTDRRAD